MPRLATLPADSEALLAAISNGIEAAYGDGFEMPGRQYLNPGTLIAWDEPQLTIAVIRIAPGQPGQQDAQSILPSMLNWSVTWGLLWLFEIPALTDSGTPETATLDAAGQSYVDYMTTMFSVAVAQRINGLLTPALAGNVSIGPITSVGPEGAMSGIALQIEASLL
jgi:hypothetical protein